MASYISLQDINMQASRLWYKHIYVCYPAVFALPKYTHFTFYKRAYTYIQYTTETNPGCIVYTGLFCSFFPVDSQHTQMHYGGCPGLVNTSLSK